MCLGEQLAKMELFLLLSNLLLRYNITFPEGYTPPKDTEIMVNYFITTCKSYEAVFTER